MQLGVNKKKYVPNLKQMQATCSRNYALLLRLLPLEYHIKQKWNFKISELLGFELEVLDTSVYTELFRLRQTNSSLPKALNTVIECRLYHDAQMVEVTKYQNRSRLRATYPYPNPDLHQKDEKHQVNTLLKDWLNLAIKSANATHSQSLPTS
jgi:hypothetical protein